MSGRPRAGTHRLGILRDEFRKGLVSDLVKLPRGCHCRGAKPGDGALQKGPNGELLTTTGYPIEPAITIPTDAVAADVSRDGSVNVTDSSGITSVIGNIQLVRFPDPAGLSSEGDNLLSETQASGSPLTGTPGESGFGTIQSGFLEKSNVSMITELVNLITAQRAYEINSQAIKVGDDMLKMANQLVR